MLEDILVAQKSTTIQGRQYYMQVAIKTLEAERVRLTMEWESFNGQIRHLQDVRDRISAQTLELQVAINILEDSTCKSGQ